MPSVTNCRKIYCIVYLYLYLFSFIFRPQLLETLWLDILSEHFVKNYIEAEGTIKKHFHQKLSGVH